MLTVNSPDVEPALLAWTREWFDLLAAGRLAEACGRLDEPNCYGTIWTPAAVLELVSETFRRGTRFARAHPEGPQFTSARIARGRERSDFGAFADGAGFWLNYDVPRNGEFSDLTAQFEFYWRAPNSLAVQLHDLHVM